MSFSQREQIRDAEVAPGFPDEETLLGDVVISVETAERQALQYGLTVEDELAMLAVHGTLHLLGYEDETEDGAETMRIKECEILNSLGIPHRRESTE